MISGRVVSWPVIMFRSDSIRYPLVMAISFFFPDTAQYMGSTGYIWLQNNFIQYVP
jgi:hypothetical protein